MSSSFIVTHLRISSEVTLVFLKRRVLSFRYIRVYVIFVCFFYNRMDFNFFLLILHPRGESSREGSLLHSPPSSTSNHGGSTVRTRRQNGYGRVNYTCCRSTVVSMMIIETECLLFWIPVLSGRIQRWKDLMGQEGGRIDQVVESPSIFVTLKKKTFTRGIRFPSDRVNRSEYVLPPSYV